MMEKIKAKFEQAKQWVSSRFDLDNKFGQVVANTELSGMVIGRKIGDAAKNIGITVKSEFQDFKDSPKEYFANKWEKIKFGLSRMKEKLSDTIDNIKENLSKDKNVGMSSAEKIAEGFRNRSENIYNIANKVCELKMRWEIEKMKIIANDPQKIELKMMILENIEKLNEKRNEYKHKAQMQRDANEVIRMAMNGTLDSVTA